MIPIMCICVQLFDVVMAVPRIVFPLEDEETSNALNESNTKWVILKVNVVI